MTVSLLAVLIFSGLVILLFGVLAYLFNHTTRNRSSRSSRLRDWYWGGMDWPRGRW